MGTVSTALYVADYVLLTIEFCEEMTKLIDEGRAMDAINIHFKKAFDKVTQAKLIQTINMIRIYDDSSIESELVYP